MSLQRIQSNARMTSRRRPAEEKGIAGRPYRAGSAGRIRRRTGRRTWRRAGTRARWRAGRRRRGRGPLLLPKARADPSRLLLHGTRPVFRFRANLFRRSKDFVNQLCTFLHCLDPVFRLRTHFVLRLLRVAVVIPIQCRPPPNNPLSPSAGSTLISCKMRMASSTRPGSFRCGRSARSRLISLSS